MAYQLKDGQGSLFKNERKEKDTHPTHKGEIMIDGKLYWLSAWVKEGKKGRFFSLSAKRKDETPDRREAPKSAPAADYDDSVPF
jgi:hypothetical protein